MNNIAAWSYVCAILLLSGTLLSAETLIRAEDYIKFTGYSERIVLITVKEVTMKTLWVKNGIEFREVSIKAKRIESVRGSDKGQDFVHTSTEHRIVDEVKAEASHSSDAIHILRRSPVHRPSSCKVDHRYLVIFLDDLTFFYEVPKDNDKWRSQILKYRDREK